MNPETDLIRKAQSGDMGAFTELVQRHDSAVFALAARYVQSAEDAKDIYQEVMIKVFRGLAGFQFRSEFSTWLHRITVNTCLSHNSRSKTALHVTLEPFREQGEHSHSQDLRFAGDGPDAAAVNADIAEQVQRALRLLSPKQRMVFTLRHYEGHSLSEIAQALRCTEGTVKRYLFVATRRLRDHLHELL